ncbi:thioredoxin family protein [Anaeroselena agilis]|uniref:Thioredoxin family protein n=1 Tax=Anaeroselena agilis TaxID=3063788 RepID=A0ABU3NXZ1_9FIRM|nr:thioredoxin family protein [Selenomonadales bacterium 4137-cl]
MKIEIFEACCGSGMYDLVLRVAGQSGAAPEVARSTDPLEAVSRGILRTPALVIDGRVMCAGRTPKQEEIAVWLAGGQS